MVCYGVNTFFQFNNILNKEKFIINDGSNLKRYLERFDKYRIIDDELNINLLINLIWEKLQITEIKNDSDFELIFDELHKMKKWKRWLKGIFDTEGIPPQILVTGSAKLDIHKKIGESLAGRYFQYRLHPLDLKEAYQFLKKGDIYRLIHKNHVYDLGQHHNQSHQHKRH